MVVVSYSVDKPDLIHIVVDCRETPPTRPPHTVYFSNLVHAPRLHLKPGEHQEVVAEDGQLDVTLEMLPPAPIAAVQAKDSLQV
jgi:hypothetical protein